MTATRDRRSDPAEDAELAWDDRPILGNFRGLPWWGGVALAFGLAAIAAVIDMQSQGSLGKIYQGAYLLGCVGAVSLVRRRSLFGPIVQPPLVFAVTAIGASVILGDGSGSGLRDLLISVALPLTSNFPTMAIATGATLAVGAYRLWKERDPNPPVRATPKKDRPTRGPRSQEPPRSGKDRAAPRKGRPRDPEDLGNRRREPESPEGRAQRGRPPRARGDRRDPSPRDRGTDRRDRDPGPPERAPGERPTRGTRPRDPDPRPRRDDRPTPRRDPGERGTPRQPRRRPPDSHR